MQIGAKYNLPNNTKTLIDITALGTNASNQMKRIQFINLFLETEIQLLFSLMMTTTMPSKFRICAMFIVCIVQYAHSSIIGFDCFNFCCIKLSTIHNWKMNWIKTIYFSSGKSVFGQFSYNVPSSDNIDSWHGIPYSLVVFFKFIFLRNGKESISSIKKMYNNKRER